MASSIANRWVIRALVAPGGQPPGRPPRRRCRRV